MTPKTKKRYGFPNYFKKIGLSLIVITFAIPLFLKMLSFDIPIKKEIMKMLVLDLIIIGLCIIILAEDKIEDEMTFQLKLREFLGSFIFVVVFIIVVQLLNLFFDGTMAAGFTAEQVVLFMCSTHVMMHYMNKWQAKRAFKKEQEIDSEI